VPYTHTPGYRKTRISVKNTKEHLTQCPIILTWTTTYSIALTSESRRGPLSNTIYTVDILGLLTMLGGTSATPLRPNPVVSPSAPQGLLYAPVIVRNFERFFLAFLPGTVTIISASGRIIILSFFVV
jgi:hypothetical protein